MKVYTLIYNSSLGSEYEVKDLLNSINEIIDWRTDISNSFMLKTKLEANQIADILIRKKPKARFFISEISDNRQGWLPKDTWNFIKESD